MMVGLGLCQISFMLQAMLKACFVPVNVLTKEFREAALELMVMWE
jgi:hypothetical protein